MARSSAVKARSQSTNQLKALLVTAPEQLREQLRGLTTTALIGACARLRPAGDVADPEHATKTALRRWPDVTSSSPKRSPTPTLNSAPW